MPDPNTEHGLRVQLATALLERDEWKRAAECASHNFGHDRKRAEKAEAERNDLRAAVANANKQTADVNALRLKQDDELVRLRTALQEIINLVMDVADTPDWRAKVGDRARLALHGEPGWKQT